jgi:formate hydrogenlyase subunit 3/multisubunit Na+/H+ antiporter MnhD subunit
VGLGVKSALVPLHTWLPDAHGRAPSSISALLSGIVIQSAFYVLLKIGLSFGLSAQEVGLGLIVLACLNMTVGNLMALVQTHVKRLLAYSTIAQMGYIMLSIGVGLRHNLPAAVQAGFFLLLAHAAMKGLAFLSKGACHFYCHTTTIVELRGIVRRLPAAALALTIALAGLAGIPPLAGFAGKWFVLAEVLRVGDAVTLVGAVIFLLNTLLALGYYLPLIVTLYAPTHAAPPIPISPWMQIPLWLLTILVIALGVYPGPWWDLIAWAVAG